MEFKLNSKKNLLVVIAFAIGLYWGLNHLGAIKSALGRIFGILEPFLLGGCIAFILNVPMKFFERRLKRLFKKKRILLRGISMLLAFVVAFGAIAFVIMTVIPELINTIKAINRGIPQFLNQLDKWVRGLTDTYPDIQNYLNSLEFNWAKISETALNVLQNSAKNFLNSTWGVATSLIGGVTTTFLGIVFALYILAQKEKLGMQIKKVMWAYLPRKQVLKILKVGRLTHRTFSSFIAGQCTEAVVFGLLCYLSMVIFRFPYAVTISVLVGFTTLIPVLGAFLGTALGAILIMVSSPLKAVWFVVMVIVLQQIDGNFIYPRIVGSSVGLPSMWVLAAVTLGGSLMGVVGMLFFVPLASVLYALLRSSVYVRLKRRSITEESIQET
mgnify:FL=1